MNTFINWNEIRVKSERGVKKTTCPNCSESRKKKNDPCLYVNFNSGVAKCFNCGALGFKDTKEFEFKLPRQDWQNFTKLSENLVKWIQRERNIGQNTLIQLGITEEKYYQPSLQKEVNNIVFNYFEGNKIVNKKYRSGNKRFTQSQGGKSIFYNINSVIGADVVYIVEGEFDVLALREVGIKSAISVPNGANDNDEYWKNSEKYLKEIERFVICVDNDEKGNELKEKIAQRLGRYKCEYVEWQNKDANGDLIKGCIKESLSKKKRFPVSGTITIDELSEGIFDFYNNGLPQTLKPKHESFSEINNFFSIMNGHLVTITGIPSHGKSEFSEWYTLNLINDYDLKASFFTPEHSPLSLHQTRVIPKVIGKPFWKSQGERVTPSDIERYVKWANQRLYYTMPEAGEVANWDWIFDKFKEQMFTYGINIFVIDAFNKVQGASTKEERDSVLSRLTMFAQTNNVVIMLVAHPTKMRKKDDGTYEMPTLYDVSGTSDFRNQTHDGYCIHRDFTDNSVMFCNLKTKYNFQGKIGEFTILSYDIPTGRYYTQGMNVPLFDMTKSNEEPKQYELTPNVEEWEVKTDCPF